MMIRDIRTSINSNPHFKEIFKGSVSVLFAKILSLCFGVVSSIIIARYYGADIVGIVAILTSVLTVFTVLGSMGTNTSILRLIPQFKETSSAEGTYAIYLKILKLIILLSISSGLLLFILSPVLANIIFHNEYLIIFFYLSAFFVLVQTIIGVNTNTLRAVQNVKLYSILQFIPSFITLFLLLIVTFLIYNKNNPIYIIFISNFIVVTISIIFIHYIFKSKNRNAKSPISSSQILSLSLPMFLTGSMHLVISQTDTIMLGMMRTESEVGIFTIAMKLALLASFILTAVNSLAAPKFSQLFHANKIDDLKEVAQKSSKLIFWTTLPLILLYILGGYYILGFFGKVFTTGYYVLIILSIGQFVNASAGSVGYFLDMTGYQKEFRNIVFLGGAINISLNIILIPKFGIEGAAFASMVSIVFWNIVSSLYIKRKFGFTISYFPLLSKIIK
jgi:O-antigen/teichoic acid export membrane protein